MIDKQHEIFSSTMFSKIPITMVIYFTVLLFPVTYSFMMGFHPHYSYARDTSFCSTIHFHDNTISSSVTSNKIFCKYPHHETTTIHKTIHVLYASPKNHNNNDDVDQTNEVGIRLNKVFKASHSRREADELISSGRVSVNGKPVLSKGGFRVIPHVDIISLDGKVIHGWEAMNAIHLPPTTIPISSNSLPLKNDVTSDSSKHSQTRGKHQKQQDVNTIHSVSSPDSPFFEYIKFWKPVGVTCTTDERIPNNIIDSIKKNGFQPKHRVYPVGRLDKDSSGIILITSDGRLPNSVLRGETKQPKIYHVTLDRMISDVDIEKLEKGVIITTVAQRDGNRSKPLTQRTKPCKVRRVVESSLSSSSSSSTTTLSKQKNKNNRIEITLQEGRNRQIRKMLGGLSYTVVELHRVSFMGISLHGSISSSKGTIPTRDSNNTNTNNMMDSNSLRYPGDWMKLNPEEMKLINRAIQLGGGGVSTGISM